MRSGRLAALALTVGSVAACHANDEAFYDGVFPCSASASGDTCGTDRAGQQLTCYAGSQLGGGSDFCTEPCDPSGPAVPGYVCVATPSASGPSGALLKTCTPPDPPPPPPPDGGNDGGANGDGGTVSAVASNEDPRPTGCPPKLNCFRTDIIANEGLCLMMPVCTTDNECRGSGRTKCTASVLRDLLPSLPTNNLYCAQDMCTTSGSSCAMGESCLPNFYARPSSEFNLCVPNCIGTPGVCPPNFACAQNPYAPDAPAICLPGVPGQRCTHDQDCLFGHCIDTGAGFSECVFMPCETDKDCFADDIDQTYVCANGNCVGITPFHGAPCMGDGDCLPEERCNFYSPYGVDNPKGECRVPCDGTLTCPRRGDVPHTCLDDGMGGCYPGDFGMPCTDSSQCLSLFECLPAAPEPQYSIITSPSICTTTCATDDQCQSSPIIRSGFCQEGICRMPGPTGAPCDRFAQCRSQTCLPDVGMGRLCQ